MILVATDLLPRDNSTHSYRKQEEDWGDYWQKIAHNHLFIENNKWLQVSAGVKPPGNTLTSKKGSCTLDGKAV
jgi:hypothetical protein